ncbi:MAG: GDP-mannose 4,6-dehydratase [Rhodospirillaceae bacterium]|jgi:GDPmannose 4,6-dehydratase|nr:GDP-mannose 4,6-dehydratase [Rhodospirillaceae bacterium]MBT6202564.1 GDP-mannose 4,6-dehydratase [Rhodospirillaceae bacterium]MBT6510837.1 GDP-mannose 4,6-dehydratase [Rhodospirillaceae bacterium]MBT7613066.1 GDP-mannose 4,6-dehydratase [Rhodospirillaceae bacterium]MBT7645990.1 GDP-mannose 4,6-dehydratase [Rhodospirillaceae bacterium]
MTTKRALVLGISGQDGAYLARLLLDKGYVVHGTSRDADQNDFSNLVRLGLRDRITLHSAVPTDFRSVFQAIQSVTPDEIYNLAGQSSVGLSFDEPAETLQSITLGMLNVLETMRVVGGAARIYNACSSDCFGNTDGAAADETTAFRPRSPYGVAKAAAFWAVANYRESYGLYACSGILFNHESPLRPERFVTRKIIAAACRIAAGSGERLSLGNTAIARDWGWAPDYVDAMWRMLQQDEADDYVVATGQSHTLEDFVARAFDAVGLDWHDHVDSDPELMRPADLSRSRGDASKAADVLGWRASMAMPGVVKAMVAAERDPDPVL